MSENKYPVHLRANAVLNNWATIVARVEEAEDMEAVDCLHTVCSPEEHARVRQWYSTISGDPESYSDEQHDRAWEDYFQSVSALHQLSDYLP